MSIFLGIDIGGSKTHAILADERGRILGFATGGAGNPSSVGHEGMTRVARLVLDEVLHQSGVRRSEILGAGFGIAGFDWESDRPALLRALDALELHAALELVNDTVLGLLAGARGGWGVAVVSGTGCNAWGWDKSRQRIGRVTGGGVEMGEFAGASELIFKTKHALAYAWTQRGPQTALAPRFVEYCGARDLGDLLAGLMRGTYTLDASAAPLVFQTAREGDLVARGLIQWAGQELGEMAKAVIRQIGIAEEEFDIALIGSMFNGGGEMIDSMRASVHELAPGARLVRLEAPPAAGALLLGMETAGYLPSESLRARLLENARALSQKT
jgi:N-acetylglucosamine kinase-like BadF-type ATPase